jgi:hypothetical protein
LQGSCSNLRRVNASLDFEFLEGIDGWQKQISVEIDTPIIAVKRESFSSIWLPKKTAALTLRRVLQGFLPSIKRKKDRGGGTMRVPFTTGVPVNAVVSCVGAFLSSQVFD